MVVGITNLHYIVGCQIVLQISCLIQKVWQFLGKFQSFYQLEEEFHFEKFTQSKLALFQSSIGYFDA